MGFYPEQTIFDKLLLGSKDKVIKKIICYDYLLEIKMQNRIGKECMIRWAQNIRHNIDIDQWLQIWQNHVKHTKLVNIKENINKMFYRWHMTPEKLSKMYTDVSNVCWKCEALMGRY